MDKPKNIMDAKGLIFFPNYKVMQASEALEEFNNLYMAYSHQVKLKNYKKAQEIAQALDEMKKHIEFYEERYGPIKIHLKLIFQG
jgi:selenocysteine lyase/cysteine desulfurase